MIIKISLKIFFRKQKCRSESETAPKPVIECDYLLPESDKDSCYVCNKAGSRIKANLVKKAYFFIGFTDHSTVALLKKTVSLQILRLGFYKKDFFFLTGSYLKNLKHLDELRKSLHINNCLDQQEAKKNLETKKEKWKKTVDCPICGEPLEPGPVSFLKIFSRNFQRSLCLHSGVAELLYYYFLVPCSTCKTMWPKAQCECKQPFVANGYADESGRSEEKEWHCAYQVRLF